jgi:hypothetical protein
MAGGDHCLGFDRLLVEVRACAATLVEAIATNGSETASLRRDLSPISSASLWGIHWPLRMSAWHMRALS